MNEREQTSPSSTDVGRVRSFARNHPVATAVGLGGLGLLGGAELAAGMLLGAGIVALMGRQNARAGGIDTHKLREKSRAIMDRVPHLRDRARAVVEAARRKHEMEGRDPSPQG